MKIIKVFLKIIGVVILISLIVVGVYLGRNYMIINKLAKVYDEFFSSSNYSYTMTEIGNIDGRSTDGEFDRYCRYYYKDGKSLTYDESKNAPEMTSVTLYDEKTQEETTIYPKLSRARIINSEKAHELIDEIGDWLSNKEKIQTAGKWRIAKEEIEGVKCYVFRVSDEMNQRMYFREDTGEIFEYVIGNGEIYRFGDFGKGETKEEDVDYDFEDFDVEDLRTRIRQ